MVYWYLRSSQKLTTDSILQKKKKKGTCCLQFESRVNSGTTVIFKITSKATKWEHVIK